MAYHHLPLFSLSIIILSCAPRSISKFCLIILKFNFLFLSEFMVMAMAISAFISVLIIILCVCMLGYIVFVVRRLLEMVRYSFILIFTKCT